ncbi:TPA: hypothetical protein HA265_05355 [Candidatus Woesearchaeota archaeon]|nr:hypothetical protein [Candidatus Woesearchaeota archaeon]
MRVTIYMIANYTYVDTEAELEKAAEQWNKEQEVGIDLECENNLHHYGAYLSIIQLSTRKHRWVVDVLRLKNIKPVLDLFENPDIQKIFHDVGFDLRIIHHELKSKVRNIFDTQIAAHLLGKKDLGLASLLEEYFKVKKEKKFQMADWTKRPLDKEMIEYAVKDTKYLILLRDILRKELKNAKRWEWAEEEFKQLEGKNWELHLPGFDELKGYHLLTPKQRGILKQLYMLREKMAKRVDRPVHFVMSTRRMFDFIQEPPTLKQWQEMKGVHPIVRREARTVYEAVERGKSQPIDFKFVPVKKYTPQQRSKAAQFNEISVKISEQLKVPGHLVLNKEQIKDIVLTGKMDGLRRWQRRIVLNFLPGGNQGKRPRQHTKTPAEQAQK